jgi:hypothetical protein
MCAASLIALVRYDLAAGATKGQTLRRPPLRQYNWLDRPSLRYRRESDAG